MTDVLLVHTHSTQQTAEPVHSRVNCLNSSIFYASIATSYIATSYIAILTYGLWGYGQLEAFGLVAVRFYSTFYGLRVTGSVPITANCTS